MVILDTHYIETFKVSDLELPFQLSATIMLVIWSLIEYIFTSRPEEGGHVTYL